MVKVLFLLLTFSTWGVIQAQNVNDNCETATDITAEIFHFSEFSESCNSIIGTLHNGFGSVYESMFNATVDGLMYGSDECIGYKPETTDHYPDLWYKTTFHDGGISFAQRLFVLAGDTVQVAVYYGQCGALFQSQCFTLTYTDSLYWQGAWIIYYPYNPEDNIYIQVKVPPHYHDQVALCFSDEVFVPGVGLQYPFAYHRPASIHGTTSINTLSPDVHFSIFPNPSNSWVSIQSPNEILDFSISDLHGRILLNGKGNANLENISLSGLPGGMYMIRVRTDKGIGWSKLIKH